MKKAEYKEPSMEVVEVLVEKGYGSSDSDEGGMSTPPMGGF